VQTLVLAGDYRVSDHGYEELRKDAILIGDVVAGITTAELVKDYRTRDRVLALQYGQTAGPFTSFGHIGAAPTGSARHG
jgi:hypothetical protein